MVRKQFDAIGVTKCEKAYTALEKQLLAWRQVAYFCTCTLQLHITTNSYIFERSYSLPSK